MKTFKQYLKENESIKHYTTLGKGHDLNTKLKNRHPLTPEEEKIHKGLSDYIKRNPLEKSKTLYRGQGEHPGKRMESAGYLSTSSDYGSAMAYAENHHIDGTGHMLHIRAPKGAKVSNVDHLSEYEGESEHLVHPHVAIHFTKHEVDEDGIHHHYGHMAF